MQTKDRIGVFLDLDRAPPSPLTKATAGSMAIVLLYTYTPGEHPSPPWPPHEHIELEAATTSSAGLSSIDSIVRRF